MHEACSVCGASFEREGGFFLGSIYFNYGLTALLATAAYVVAMLNRWDSNSWLLFGLLAFVVLFPIWFFRYARSLWFGFDQYFDPRPGEQGTGRR